MKIAIAEDDFRVASIHEQFLEKIDGVEVAGKALNASEALALLEDKEIDVLLLDNYLPDRSGVSILPELRSKFPMLDVILITASTERKVVEPAIRNGVLDYIVKPVDFNRFKAALEKVMNRRELLESDDEFNQSVIDQVLSGRTSGANPVSLPKGIDPLTLTKVQETMESLNNGINAEDLSEHLGASRTTARRYLEYLISTGKAKAELEYGIVGRPERKYYLI
ncbi:response regulator of citrate/malate metabolism [Cytobacillus oceanisediminis]|uniref:Response regulator of citrate/malate metabolism n=1 Tax=Cytobacillus oceanisediminis TaxID=665099 RepID=A0A2V3A609_9BACI|nr:response regulator [Cytobacillus oceanisediminis]PWW29016.1 response regulator of citrate/malate metabolism [Cytobacillus oceanisediminis]